MWTHLKCKVCGIEYANSDITLEEIEREEHIETDDQGQYLIVCEDCQ